MITSAELDHLFPLEAGPKADAIFENYAPGYERKHFDGVAHGFAIRGDMSIAQQKNAKEEAFKGMVSFLNKHY